MIACWSLQWPHPVQELRAHTTSPRHFPSQHNSDGEKCVSSPFNSSCHFLGTLKRNISHTSCQRSVSSTPSFPCTCGKPKSQMKTLCTDFAIHEPKSVYDNIVLSVGAIHFGYTWVGRTVEIRALMPKVPSSFFLNEFIRWSPQKCSVSLCVTRDIRVSCTQGTQSIESGIQTHVFQDERLPDDLRQKISPS